MQRAGSAPNNRNVTGEFYEYAWHWENRAGQDTEDFVPASTFQYTLMHFSDYKSWADVANWAEKSFHPEKLTEALYQRIMRIRDENTSSEQRVLKALQFVQDDIRYLGIENGMNSHQPTDPSIVFTRGYGDCKDKDVLLAALLEAEGWHTSSALISTFREFDRDVPSPWPFTHVVTVLSLRGKQVWMDSSTPLVQFRTLPHVLHKKRALVLSPDATPHFEDTP